MCCSSTSRLWSENRPSTHSAWPRPPNEERRPWLAATTRCLIMTGITTQRLASPADFALPVPPAPLLPMLTLKEAQDVVELPATVAAGGVVGSGVGSHPGDELGSQGAVAGVIRAW